MIDTKKIIEAAERHLEGTDRFVVECTCTPGNEIELTIDSDTTVGIDACVELSRAIEADLDRDAEDFSLTVASAGIGSDLRTLRQYRKITGRPVEVLLTSGVKILAGSKPPTRRASPSPTRRSRPSRAKNASSSYR